ncbi:MAG: DUF421 domain-containing protein [Pseudobdellovibrionaceae bacterium]
MIQMNIPWWEFILRASIVYFFLLVSLRISGKRQVGQLAPFDLVLLLVLSNAVQNSMNGGDNSLIGGLISALTLIFLNFSVGYLTYKNKKVEKIIEGTPKIIIDNGKIHHSVMQSEQLTQHELDSAMRQAGCLSAEEVRFAILENNGAISVIPYR